jgi:regulator of sigma E protease
VWGFVTTLAIFLFVIGVLVFVHELGHFVAAKLFRIRVEVFSLGFGPRLLGFRRGETDYRISAIPLGGYVKMLGENPEDVRFGPLPPEAFLARPKWQRFVVALAGPAMNLLLAVLLPAAVFMVSYPGPAYRIERAQIGAIVPGSPAERAGLRPGDVIVEFDGRRNPTWGEVEDLTMVKPNQTVVVVVERQGERLRVPLTLEAARGRFDVIGESGILPPPITDGVVIADVERGSPAEAAGLRPGDKIIRINDVEITAFPVLVALVSRSAGKALTLTYVREGQLREVTVVPFNDRGRGRIGIAPEPEVPLKGVVRMGLGAALRESIRQNLFYGRLTLEALVEVFRGERTVRETFAGPVRIADLSGKAAERGWRELLIVMSFISLSLGLFNLFPIPVLDGGLILMLGVEWIMGLAGKELTMSLREKIQTVGLALILLLMGYVIYSDIAITLSERARPEGPPPAHAPH